MRFENNQTGRLMKTVFIFSLFALLAACSTTPSSTQPADASVPDAPSAPSASKFTHDTDIESTIPTPNPPWYGQGPYRNPKLLTANAQATFPPPVYQASWATPDWYIDPVGGSDTNDCVTTGTPCKTYAQIAARWGTYAPRIRQVTTLHFLNSQPDNTDPVIWFPYIENGSYASIVAVLPTASQTGTLASVVAKNRSTPQLLNVTIGAGGTAGQLIVNTTHPSRAFLKTNTAGNAWNVTQPLAPLTPASFAGSGTEVDTWANGDAYSVYTLLNVFVVDFSPVWIAGSSNFSDDGFIYQIVIPPLGTSPVLQTNGAVALIESRARVGVMVNDATPGQFSAVNVYTTGGYTIGTPGIASYGTGGPPAVIGGGYATLVLGQNILLSLGVITDTGSPYPNNALNVVLNDVYIDSTTFSIGGLSQITGFLWGTGALNVEGQSRLTYPSGAGAAVANILVTGGVKLNNTGGACSHSNATPDVVDCNINLTPAHLDAAQGASGFGGLAYNPGGASITNGSL